MINKIFLLTLTLVVLALVVAAQPAKQADNREADLRAIQTEIENITQAFIDGDIQKIHDTHSDDWRGFLNTTQVPIKGIDDTNDREKLEKMIPEEALAINIDGSWDNRAAILEGARNFVEGGGKLTRLEFPRTEIQVYGNTVILYTSYSYDGHYGHSF